MSRFRMVRSDLCEKLAALQGPLGEMGAAYAASLVAEIALSPECPTPSWPDSIYVLDRVHDKLRAFSAALDDERIELARLSDAADKQSLPVVDKV